MLHIGKGAAVPLKDIVLILDYKEAMINNDTNTFLKKLCDSAHTFFIEEFNIKSVVVSRFLNKDFIYYSPISPVTLYKRSKQK